MDFFLENKNFTVIDIETTGSDPRRDDVMEVGLVHIKNGEITSEDHWTIRPRRKIPPYVQRLTSLNEKKLAQSPYIEEVTHELYQKLHGQNLIAHNSSFDLPFMQGIFKRYDEKELKFQEICTQALTNTLFPSLITSNLKYLCKLFNIPLNKAHRALEDARATAHIFLLYQKLFKHHHSAHSAPESKNFEHFHFSPKEATERLPSFLSLAAPKLVRGFCEGRESLVMFFTQESTDLDFIQQQIAQHQCDLVTLELQSSLQQAIGQTLKAPSYRGSATYDFLGQKISTKKPLSAFYYFEPHYYGGQLLYGNNFHKNQVVKYPQHQNSLQHLIKKYPLGKKNTKNFSLLLHAHYVEKQGLIFYDDQVLSDEGKKKIKKFIRSLEEHPTFIEFLCQEVL